MTTFTLPKETCKRFAEFAKKKSINKSAFVDRVINQEIDREEKLIIQNSHGKETV